MICLKHTRMLSAGKGYVLKHTVCTRPKALLTDYLKAHIFPAHIFPTNDLPNASLKVCQCDILQIVLFLDN